MSLLTGEQSGYYIYKQNQSETSHQYSQYFNSLNENKLETITNTTKSFEFKRNISLQPVYVKIIDGIEQLVYNSRIMEINKEYRVTWNNEEFILIKNENNIDFYKFFPEK